MNAWQDTATAPRDGTLFGALNYDGEIWISKFIDDRIVFRTNKLYEPRRFEHVEADGETLLREDTAYAQDNEYWRSGWTYWTRGYDFKPTHWMPLPTPPQDPQP